MSLYDITTNETQDGHHKHHNNNHELTVIATGSFGGGALTLQIQCPDESWVDLPDAQFTAAVSKLVAVRQPAKLRYVVSGATTPTIKLQLN